LSEVTPKLFFSINTCSFSVDLHQIFSQLCQLQRCKGEEARQKKRIEEIEQEDPEKKKLEQEMNKKRKFIVDEILSTEKSYVTALSVVVHVGIFIEFCRKKLKKIIKDLSNY
jgi:hypothetical protein